MTRRGINGDIVCGGTEMDFLVLGVCNARICTPCCLLLFLTIVLEQKRIILFVRVFD